MTLETLLTVATLTAASSGPVDVVLNGTRAQELERRFNQAAAATKERVQGWHSGRCYLLDNQDHAVGNLLVVETKDRDGNNGPIFDRPVTKVILVGRGGQGADAPADHFDNPGPSLRRDIQEFVDAAYPYTTEAALALNSYTSEMPSYDVRWELRTDGQYTYARVLNPNFGRIQGYCYFFKKVK